MPSNNGKQRHLTTAEIIAKARERHSVPWHWGALDMKALIRPRTTAENAEQIALSNRHNADIEAYKGTADEPTPTDAMRIKIAGMIPCLLYPDDMTPIFTPDDVEALLELDTPTLQEVIEKVDAVSNFTQAQAEENEKNFAETDESSSSSVSPSAAAAPTSSPTPIR